MNTVLKAAIIGAILASPMVAAAASQVKLKAAKTTTHVLNKGAVTALSFKLGCQVAGTPVEFPNDLWVKNTNRVALSAGKTAHWTIAGTSIKGTAALPALAPGQAVYLTNVIPGGLPAGTGCMASAR